MVWNPSEGIDLGFFMIRYYSLMFVIAFGLGWYIMKKIFERENESIEKLDSLKIDASDFALDNKKLTLQKHS
jgi:prolipoprotein diacylglyceryltransferase